jgi:hypothetical protein
MFGPAGAVAVDPDHLEADKPGRPKLTLVPKVDDDAVDCEVEDSVLLVEGAVVRVEVKAVDRIPPAAAFPMANPRVGFSCVDIDSGEILYAYAELPKKLKHTMKFYRWWAMALGHKPARPDRPPRLSIFVGKKFLATVRTVRRDYKRQALDTDALHSVIDLTSLIQGN